MLSSVSAYKGRALSFLNKQNFGALAALRLRFQGTEQLYDNSSVQTKQAICDNVHAIEMSSEQVEKIAEYAHQEFGGDVSFFMQDHKAEFKLKDQLAISPFILAGNIGKSLQETHLSRGERRSLKNIEEHKCLRGREGPRNPGHLLDHVLGSCCLHPSATQVQRTLLAFNLFAKTLLIHTRYSLNITQYKISRDAYGNEPEALPVGILVLDQLSGKYHYEIALNDIYQVGVQTDYSSFLKLKVDSSKPGFTPDLLRDDKHKQIFGRIMAKFSTFLKEAGVQKKISK